MVTNERNVIVGGRLSKRAKFLLEQCYRDISIKLIESKATKEELESEHKLLTKTREDLLKGKSVRERQFINEWDDAFAELENALCRIRKELNEEYGALIDNTPFIKIQQLSQIIHSDVTLSLSERLRPQIMR